MLLRRSKCFTSSIIIRPIINSIGKKCVTNKRNRTCSRDINTIRTIWLVLVSIFKEIRRSYQFLHTININNTIILLYILSINSGDRNLLNKLDLTQYTRSLITFIGKILIGGSFNKSSGSTTSSINTARGTTSTTISSSTITTRYLKRKNHSSC